LKNQIRLEFHSIVIEHLPSLIKRVSRLGMFLLDIDINFIEISNDKTFNIVGFDHFRSGFR
jgi:hypothetical protein